MQGLPDLAAGIRALTQLTASHVQPHMQSQMQPALQSLPKPLEDDHGAVMATGMQNSGFVPQVGHNYLLIFNFITIYTVF